MGGGRDGSQCCLVVAISSVRTSETISGRHMPEQWYSHLVERLAPSFPQNIPHSRITFAHSPWISNNRAIPPSSTHPSFQILTTSLFEEFLNSFPSCIIATVPP